VSDPEATPLPASALFAAVQNALIEWWRREGDLLEVPQLVARLQSVDETEHDDRPKGRL
jgi:hypothetical protein